MNLDEALNPDLIGFDGYGNVTLPREAFEAVHAAARECNQNADSVNSGGVGSGEVELERLREALEHPWTYEAEHAGPVSSAVVAAARRFLALTETGPDYEAAREALWLELDWDSQPEGYDGAMSIPEIADKIVDAALADYLTEEEG